MFAVAHSCEASPRPRSDSPSTSPSLTPFGGELARNDEAVAVPKRAMLTAVACAAAVGSPVAVGVAEVEEAREEEEDRVATTMELVDDEADLAAL